MYDENFQYQLFEQFSNMQCSIASCGFHVVQYVLFRETAAYDRGFTHDSGVMNLPAMRETWVRSLDQEDPLEWSMITQSSIFAWRIPRTEKPVEDPTVHSVQLLSCVRLFATP